MKRQKAFLLVASILAGFAAFLMLSPFMSYLLTGVLLAFVFYPLHRRVKPKLGDTGSAALMIVLTLVAAVLPFVIVLGAVGSDAANLLSSIRGSEIEVLSQAELLVENYTGQEVELQDYLKDGVRKLASLIAGSLSGALGFAADVSIGVSLMLFLQFYALRDGKSFVDWTREFDFMPDRLQDELYDKTSNSTWAVIKGHVFIAVAIGILSGIGLFLTGVPNPFFWTFVMVLMGFIPLIGTAFIWIPASIYLFLNGQVGMAAVLFIYSAVVSTLADNFLRPFLVDESADIHPFFIIAGVVGGIGVFGPTGLFIGPVIFGVLKSLLNMVKEEYEDL